MDSSTDFNNIYLSSTAKAGKASFTAEAIEWRATKTSEPALLADASTLHKATWTELGQHASLQLYLKGYEEPVPVGRDTSDEERPVGEEKRFYRLSDFSAKDEDLVRRLVARVDSGLELEKEPVDVRGLNMGEFVLDSHKQCISVRSEVGLVAEIPLTGVSQVVTAGKSEVEIQYLARRGDEITGGDQCELMTVRMHVPEDAEDMDMTDIWAANIKAACDVQEDEQGDSVLCEIPDEIANFLAPRGKYRMELHKDFFRMRGKTYDFKVLYSAVSAVYLLEKPDLTMGLEHDREVKTKIVLNKLLVISLDTPVRQGQQRYPHLVIQLANEPGTINLQMTEEQIAALYGDNGTATLAPMMRGPIPETVAKVFRVLADKRVFVGGFTSAFKQQAVKCNYKTNAGFLYPMKKSLLFVHKPVLYLRFDQMESIEFARQTHDTKTWDLTVEMKMSTADYPSGKVQFQQIPKEEYSCMFRFLENTGVAIRGKKQLEASLAKADSAVPDDRKNRAAKMAAGTIHDLSDEEEDDDEDEEEDSDFEDDDDEEEGEEGQEKKKKEKAAEQGGEDGEAGSSSGDDSSSGDGSSSDSDMAEEVSMDSDELDDTVVTTGKRKPRAAPSASSTSKPDRPKKAPKAKKDPLAPKNAKSSWLFFMERRRPEVVGNNPGISMTDATAKLAELWRQCSPEDKRPFEEQALADKQRYHAEMEAYKLTPGYRAPVKKGGAGGSKAKEGGGRAGGKASKQSDANKPKKAKTANQLFSEAKRPELKAQGITALGEQAKKLAEMFKALSEDDRKHFLALAAEDKARFEREMKSYVPAAESSSEDSSSDDDSSGPEPAAKRAKPVAESSAVADLVESSSSSEEDGDESEDDE